MSEIGWDYPSEGRNKPGQHSPSYRKPNMSHIGSPRVIPSCPLEELGTDCESKHKRNPRAPEIVTVAIKSLITLARDGQPAGSEIWCHLDHSPGPTEFREVLPWISLVMGLLPSIVFSNILITLVSTLLKTTQGCFLHWKTVLWVMKW